VVHVHDQQRGGAPVARGAGGLADEERVERAPVVDLGQGVGDDHLLELSGQVAETPDHQQQEPEHRRRGDEGGDGAGEEVVGADGAEHQERHGDAHRPRDPQRARHERGEERAQRTFANEVVDRGIPRASLVQLHVGLFG